MSQTGVTVPTLFALLSNKETSRYQRVFQFLRDEGVKKLWPFYYDFNRRLFEKNHKNALVIEKIT